MSSPPNDGCPRCLAFGHLGWTKHARMDATDRPHIRIDPDQVVTSILDIGHAASYHFRPCPKDWFVTRRVAHPVLSKPCPPHNGGRPILRGFLRSVAGTTLDHRESSLILVGTWSRSLPTMSVPRSLVRRGGGTGEGSPNQGGRPVGPPRSNRPSKPANCATPRLSSVTCHLFFAQLHSKKSAGGAPRAFKTRTLHTTLGAASFALFAKGAPAQPLIIGGGWPRSR
jgi:hypothetical protein